MTLGITGRPRVLNDSIIAEIKKLSKEGYSTFQIHQHLNLDQTQVTYWISHTPKYPAISHREMNRKCEDFFMRLKSLISPSDEKELRQVNRELERIFSKRSYGNYQLRSGKTLALIKKYKLDKDQLPFAVYIG